METKPEMIENSSILSVGDNVSIDTFRKLNDFWSDIKNVHNFKESTGVNVVYSSEHMSHIFVVDDRWKLFLWLMMDHVE